jgi:hypothetical protein
LLPSFPDLLPNFPDPGNARSKDKQKGPEVTGAFLLEKIKPSLVLQPEIRDIAVPVCDLGIGHQDPVDGGEQPAEQAGDGGEAERSSAGHWLFPMAKHRVVRNIGIPDATFN